MRSGLWKLNSMWSVGSKEQYTLRNNLRDDKSESFLHIKKYFPEGKQREKSKRSRTERLISVIMCHREFDPGSGRTLAVCLIHASRTELSGSLLLRKLSGGRVSNAWVTCLKEGDNTEKFVLIPHNVAKPHDFATKGQPL